MSSSTRRTINGRAPSRTAPLKDGSYRSKPWSVTIRSSWAATLARKSPILQSIKRSFDVAAGENTFDFDLSAK